MKIKRYFKVLKIFTIFIMITLILYEGHIQIKSIDFAKTIMLIRSFSNLKIILFFLMGLLGISSMTLYDFVIIRYLKLGIKPLTVFNISFVANTINNVSGLGGLTGASIRAVFFKKKTNTKEDILNYSMLLIPATGVGLSVMSIFSLLGYKYISPIIEQNRWLMVVLIFYISYLFIYFSLDKFHSMIKKQKYSSPNAERLTIRMKLLFISFIQWILAYLFILILVRQFNTNIDIFSIFSVFTLASIAGIISLLPGGVGSFDLVMLLGLEYYSVPGEHILTILILYRTFYYFIPLVIGMIVTLAVQLLNDENPVKHANISKIMEFINKTSGITNLLLRGLVFISGMVLLISALIPGVLWRMKIGIKLLSLPILQWSHQLSICIGILLVIISREIGMKVKRAYKLTFYLLLFGSIFTFLKGFDYEEAIFLGIVLLLLNLSKKSFYRKSLPSNRLVTILTIVSAFVGMVIYIRLKHLILIDFLHRYNFLNIFQKGAFNPKWNGIIGYISLIVFLIYWHISKTSIKDDERYESMDEVKINEFLSKYKGHYLTHLIYLRDKHLFWGADVQVLIVYEISHNVVVVLGDPIGDNKYFGKGISEFLDFIDEYGYKASFYQVSDHLLPIYHDNGFSFFKLGETAIVNLKEFDMIGPKYRDFRNVISRFKKDGYDFQLYESITEELFLDLQSVSVEWLSGRKEMGFSLGWFDYNYLGHSPIGIVKKLETNEIVAFSSLMPCYNNKQSISLDLMRFKNKVPNNTMTFLILNLLISYREEGYEFFNLGMAPLANVGQTQNAHLREKIAHLVTKYGNHFYSFDGLRNYKNKFDPQWEPRYLAYDDLIILPSSLIEATALIHSAETSKQ